MNSEPDKSFDQLFSNDGSVELLTIRRMVDWFRWEGKGKLRLPPIQRSFVWRNEQIVNYWDSLMRGYPAGMMMVRSAKSKTGACDGIGLDNKTEKLADTDFQLFDGQQRLTALLLGLGYGSLSHSIKLWVDIGKPNGSGDRLYELRVNSTGQPFGYRSGEPNAKINADDRRAAQGSWPTQDGNPSSLVAPDVIFEKMAREPIGKLSSAKCTVPLSDILNKLRLVGKEATRKELLALAADSTANSGGADIEDLLEKLEAVLDAEIVVKLLDRNVLDDSNYPRFFARLGQGGTRLSDDELIYSLIKDRYPYVHDRVDDIVKGPGRFTSEVDLILGALRVSQALAPWPDSNEWEQIGRPTPDRVRQLKEMGTNTTEPYFLSLLPEDDNVTVRLKSAIENLRVALLFDAARNSHGLPSMLLARMPRDLLDALLLFAFKRGETLPWEGEDRKTLIAFVLHWLLFVADNSKAAYHSFKEVRVKSWSFKDDSVAALIHHFESEGIARHAPRSNDWPSLRDEVQQRGCRLATWAERFSSLDVAGHSGPGEALRILSTHDEVKKRVLIWVQRHYITQTFPHYDPTSTRDDDLPFDLDHAIPHGRFGADWRVVQQKISLAGTELLRFKDHRGTVGNSLGNFRWLSAADNRGRKMGPLEAERAKHGNKPPLDDYIDRTSWNGLLEIDIWADEHVAAFQRLIDGRTLTLTKMLMDESGITSLVDRINILSIGPD